MQKRRLTEHIVPGPEFRLAGGLAHTPGPGENSAAAPSAILVVDDDPKNLAAIEVALGGLSAEIVRATSGKAALRCLLQQDFAVILLDVQMPTMDGFETAELIRRRKRSRHVPIIFITAVSHNDEDIQRGYRLGAVDYLFKPIVSEVLRAKVQVFVDLRERTAEVARQAERLRQLERAAIAKQLEEERRNWEAQALRREMEEQQRINTQLAEADQRKDEFIALLAHELRNPLAPILGGVELMRRRRLEDPVSVRALDAMDRQIRHLTRLVDDLMDVARISRGKLELQRSHVDLRDVVQDAVKSCEPIIARYEHALSLVLGSSPIPVFADPVRIAQVVTNLLHNAARYTDPGGQITVRCENRDHTALLSVEDSGRGIPPEMVERIFEMFVQARESGRGLGLGLTLVKQLVELHAGAIDVRSDGSGKGATFTVRLPVSPASAEEDAEPSAARLPGDLDDDAPKLRVVVVDDDDDIRETVQLLLEDCGQSVKVAPDAFSGFDLIVATAPDVAVLDIGLPDMDGYELARRVIDHMGERRPALVAVTGYGQAHDRIRAIEAGFDVHLVKPASVDTIQASVRKACEARGHRRSAAAAPQDEAAPICSDIGEVVRS